MTIDEQLAYLRKGTVEIIREADLKAKLEKSAKTGKPLRIKLGADPTAPDIHLGHRRDSNLRVRGWATVIFLIGDFTGLIGIHLGKCNAASTNRGCAAPETYRNRSQAARYKDRNLFQLGMDGQTRI